METEEISQDTSSDVDENVDVESFCTEEKEKKTFTEFLLWLKYVGPDFKKDAKRSSSMLYPFLLDPEEYIEVQCGMVYDDLNEEEKQLLENKVTEFNDRWVKDRVLAIKLRYPKIPFTEIHFTLIHPFKRINHISTYHFYSTFPCCCLLLTCLCYLMFLILIIMMTIFLSYTSDFLILSSLLSFLTLYPEFLPIIIFLQCFFVCCPCLVHLCCYAFEFQPIFMTNKPSAGRIIWSITELVKTTIVCFCCCFLCLKCCPCMCIYYLICPDCDFLCCEPVRKARRVVTHIKKYSNRNLVTSIEFEPIELEGIQGKHPPEILDYNEDFKDDDNNEKEEDLSEKE